MMDDHTKDMYIHMLTERMRWARKTQKALDTCLAQDAVNQEAYFMLDGMNVSATDETRDCIREIARACRFEDECVNAITGEAWTASKEDA